MLRCQYPACLQGSIVSTAVFLPKREIHLTDAKNLLPTWQETLLGLHNKDQPANVVWVNNRLSELYATEKFYAGHTQLIRHGQSYGTLYIYIYIYIYIFFILFDPHRLSLSAAIPLPARASQPVATLHNMSIQPTVHQAVI